MSELNIVPQGVPAREIVFIDSRVKDADVLLQGLAPGVEVVYIDAQTNGLAQMAAVLGESGQYSAVHVFGHGDEGQLWLGDTFLDGNSLSGQEATLAALGRGITEDGDLLIYACDLGEGEVGAQFVATLAQLTGADVAASNDRTGAGGDWNLEITSGTVESVGVLSQQAMDAYAWSLATITVTSNASTGAGSLRAALANAQNGDIVTFASGMTVSLDAQLVVNKNITIDGDLNNDGIADVTLDGQYQTSVIQVTSGTTTTFDGVIITKGRVSTAGANSGSVINAADALGAGISNAGNLTLLNTTVTANAAAGGGGGGGVLSPNIGGGGGGGGGIGGQNGAAGGGAGSYSPSSPSTNTGGNGAAFSPIYFGGRGGNASGGGAGGVGTPYGYTNGGAGGTATSAGITIGGGGGGAGFDANGGRGGAAAGGIFNGSTGTLSIIGTSNITGNIGAGGGGGGGGSIGGNGGVGVGGIWNQGTLNITAANNAAMNNKGVSGVGGQSTSGGTTGISPTASDNIRNDGTQNTSYVADTTAPTISSIVIANTSLTAGNTSLVTFTFDEKVFGLDISEITVPNGTLTNLTTADNVTWTATLTAAANATSASNAISLSGSAVQDSAGNIGTGTKSSNNYAVDTVGPTATITMADTALTTGETSLVTFTFNEAVTGFTNADLTIPTGTLSVVSSSDGGLTWTAIYTPNANVSSNTNLITLNNAGVTDQLGNAGTGSTNSPNFTINTVQTTATVVVASNALKIGSDSLVTFTFSEAVTGLTNAALTVPNGTLTPVSSTDGGITWTATLTPTAGVTSATNVIAIDMAAATAGASNPGSGSTPSNNYTVDTERPTATIVVANNALKAGETSLVTFTFNEAVTGFTNADLTLAGGMLSAVSSADGGTTWTATFTPSADTTSTGNVITLNNTGVADLAGNAGTSTKDSNSFAIDTARPTANITMSDSALVVGETSLVTFTFSEVVTGFTNAALTVPNGTLSTVSSADGGLTWTATYTPTANVANGTNVIALNTASVTDAAGNTGLGSSNSPNFTINTVQATATVVLGNSALKVGDTSLVTVTFSEAVTGFTNAALTVPSGTLSTVSSADGGITWTATFTPAAGISNAANAIVVDMTAVTAVSGNPSVGTASSSNYAVDTLRPTATIGVDKSTLKAGDTALVTITFSEAVNNFTNADLNVASGTLSAVSSVDGGITWTATLTPSAGTTASGNVITLSNSGVTDLAGNAGSGLTPSSSYLVDTAAPTATITVANLALKAGDTSLVTIAFSEAVTGFSNASLTVPNGTLSTISSADGGMTWTAIYTPTAGVISNAGAIGLTNAGVTDVAGNVVTGTANSANITINTVRPTATIVMSDTAVVEGDLPVVTITFSEAVTGFANDDLTTPGGTLSAVTSTDGGVTWTATFTPNSNVGTQNNAIALNMAGVTNASGNTGAGTATSGSYSVDTVVPTPPSTGPTTPTGPATGVDGAQVSTGTAPDGSTVTTIAPVTADRVDDPTSVNAQLADVPLVRGSNGEVILQVSVPVGVGLQVQGNANASTGDAALAELVNRIRDSSSNPDLLGSGQSFVGGLGANTPLTVRTITGSTAAGFDPAVPLVISGNTTGQQAIVLDTRSLPTGSIVRMDNVNFAAVVGAAHLIGGAGSNVVFADDAVQFIVLGADDDVIHGGGANDTVGSLRGKDQTFGDAGDDVVYGGTDNDTLSGGTGNDRLNGGFGLDTALQSGTLADYVVTRDGNTVVLTHRTSGEIDRLLDVEVVSFDSGPGLVIAHEASDVAMLTALHPTAQLIELNLTRAVTGAEGNDVVTPTMGIGLNIDLGAGQDVVRLAGGRASVHLDVEADRLVELTRLEDGAMLSFRNTELLAFANGDVTVLAQTKEQAIVGRSYELILDRNVDVEGFQFWAGMLQAGASLQTVMGHIVRAPESSGVMALSDSAFLDQLYLRGFDRAADASGKAYWMDALARGESRAKVLESFAGSNEAIALIGSTVDVSLMT
ncbi:DUF4347 domain-containing protein [Pigmentiphaga aceris]|uniref:DUF4347 domain-containing protein n=1 Tax=Pigmentiphaga aceris TaxID=1940612 RepID=A0A5C0ARQ2_9BURK|nr:Ig-like domain-containing protein [Pigmentiphaga aceris]QEI04819.1 DUF4347 domain-containing protein [Pigmentiphaga aceris]